MHPWLFQAPIARNLKRLAALFALLAATGILPASRAGAVLIFGEGNGVPAGYTPKDFTILQHDGVFHAFYILSNPVLQAGTNLARHLNERRFGHAVSTDLAVWTFVDSNFAVDPGAFDRHHLWAPTLLWADGRYWMFYTGVTDSLEGESWLPERMQIGLAWTTDFSFWGRTPTPIFRCGPPDSPWADCGEGGLRDPFVMRADTSATGSGWFMYFVTQPSSAPPGHYDPLAFLVGAASGYDGDMTYWRDFGPNWSTYKPYQQVPGENTNKVESPHLYKIGNLWYLFFTGDQGIAYLTGSTPVGDIPVHQNEWTYRGRLDDVGYSEFASETFKATWSDGTTEDYFATVNSTGGYRNEIMLRIFDPTPGGPLLADPLALNEIHPLRAVITEGETLKVVVNAELGTVSGAIFQVLTRPAPIEVWEADDSLGVRTWSRLDPAAVGIPSVPRVTTHYSAGDYGDTLKLTPRWIPDNDATPNRLELQFRFRGLESAIVAVGRAGYGVTGVEETPGAPLALRANTIPGRTGATLRLELPARARARLDLYDLRGRRVRSMFDRVVEAGTTSVTWDGRDDHGELVPSGVTFAVLRAGSASARARVLTIR